MKMRAPSGVTSTQISGVQLKPNKKGEAEVPDELSITAQAHGWTPLDGEGPALTPEARGVETELPKRPQERSEGDLSSVGDPAKPAAAGGASVGGQADAGTTPPARGGTAARMLKAVGKAILGDGDEPKAEEPATTDAAAPRIALAEPQPYTAPPGGVEAGDQAGVPCALCPHPVLPQMASIDVPEVGICHLVCANQAGGS